MMQLMKFGKPVLSRETYQYDAATGASPRLVQHQEPQPVQGTEFECLWWMRRNLSQSFQYHEKHDGYRLVAVKDEVASD